MANPVDTLYRILADPIAGLRIVADDGVRVINADPGGDKWIDLQKDPYAQEGLGDSRPQVIVGPGRGVGSMTFVTLFQHELHVRVEVRIITRDWDDDGRGFTLNDGQVTGEKIRDAIVSLIEFNKSNPGGDGTINYCFVASPGVAKNTPEGPPKWMTTMQIEFVWFA